MSNKKFWLGMLVMALVFGMTVVGCNNGSTSGGGADPLNGTWVDDDDDSWVIIFNNGNYEISGQEKGTYTTSGSTITFTQTHAHGDYFYLAYFGTESRWYTKSEVAAIVSDTFADNFFEPVTCTYSISGNKLTLTFESGIYTHTRL